MTQQLRSKSRRICGLGSGSDIPRASRLRHARKGANPDACLNACVQDTYGRPGRVRPCRSASCAACDRSVSCSRSADFRRSVSALRRFTSQRRRSISRNRSTASIVRSTESNFRSFISILRRIIAPVLSVRVLFASTCRPFKGLLLFS